jgi:hypothetical protein
LFFNTNGALGSSYDYLEADPEEEDEKFMLTVGYGVQDYNLTDMNNHFSNNGGLSAFTEAKAYWEVMFMGVKNRFSSSTSFGVLRNESVNVADSNGVARPYELKGYFIKDMFYYNLFKDANWISVKPGIGFGYSNLSLNFREENLSDNDLASGSIGGFRNIVFVNDAFVIDLGAIVDFNFKWLTVGYHGGYNIDVSDKRWKSGQEHMDETFTTSLGGLYSTLRLGVNF